MNISIKKLDFKRAFDGSIPFTEYNISLLLKYVLPVISKNPGWSTDDLDEGSFLADPEKWRDDIDAIILNDPKGEVYVALDGGKPAGLLGYVVEDFDDLSEKDFSNTLEGMVRDRGSSHWQNVLEYDFLSSVVLDKYHNELEMYFRDKRFYKGVAVVLLPSLQGKKSGISDLLFKMMSNGIIFGWTSTPLVIAKFNKLYRKTIFFPLLDEAIKDLDELACLTVLAARTYARYPETLEKFRFGVKTDKGFALRDKKEYMKLSRSFVEKGKISENDLKRLDYILDFKQGQGAILSVA